MPEVEFEGELWRQRRDDENCLDVVIRTSGSEFKQAIQIPVKRPLKIMVSWEE